MNDTYVETTRTSWLSRIKSAIAGIIIGPLVIAGTIYFLGWNEGRSAGTIAALEQGKKEVVAITPDTLNPSLEGKLVYSSGPVKTSEVLSDPIFAVSKNALWLRRDAEMYQWKEDSKSETRKTLGGGEETTTTYSYHLVWEDHRIDSSQFKRRDGHENPQMRYGEDVVSRIAQATPEGRHDLAAAARSGQRRHARIVPAVHMFFLDELNQLAFR